MKTSHGFSTIFGLFGLVVRTLASEHEGERRATTEGPPMKAIVMHEYGGLDVLKYEDAPRPEPNEDEILVRVIAAGVNPVDVAIRKGYMARANGRGELPMSPGLDIAGVVQKTGGKVMKVKKGDAVYAFLALARGGGYAEFAIAEEGETASKPKSLSYEQAAAVPLAASTAWQALIDTAKLNAGQTVLIHGGSGGVGSFAIQIAKAHGAKVIATASTPNQDLLKELGADQAIDYTTTKFEDVVKDVDVVLDCVGHDTLARSYGVVKKGGIIVSIAGSPEREKLAEHGIRGESIMVQPKTSVLKEITKLIEGKKLKPIVSQTFPLREAAKAQEAIATRHTRGKIVLKVADGRKWSAAGEQSREESSSE